MSVQPAWSSCHFEDHSVFALGLPVELTTRLWAAGYRTIAALDELVGDYREQELRALLGQKDYRLVLRRLLEHCRRRLLATIAAMNLTGESP